MECCRPDVTVLLQSVALIQPLANALIINEVRPVSVPAKDHQVQTLLQVIILADPQHVTPGGLMSRPFELKKRWVRDTYRIVIAIGVARDRLRKVPRVLSLMNKS